MGRKFLKIAIICLIIGAFTSALAFVNYFGILRDMKTSAVTAAAEYLVESISAEGDTDDKEAFLTELVDCGRNYTMTGDVIEDVHVYDIENDSLIGTTDSSALRTGIDPSVEKVHVSGSYIYTPYAYKDCIIWFQNSMDDILAAFRDFVHDYAVIFPVIYLILCLISWIALHIAQKHPGAIRAIYISIFLSTVIMSCILILGMIRTEIEYSDADIARRLMSVEYGVAETPSLSDEEVAGIISTFDDEDQDYMRTQAGDDDRLALLYGLIVYDAKFDPSMIDMKLKDNIWDQDIPIEDRVEVTYDYEKILQDALDYLLQSVMLGILAVILLMQLLSYDKEKRFSNIPGVTSITELPEEFKSILHNADKMRFFLAISSLAGMLTAVLTVSMLKAFLIKDCGFNAKGYLSAIIMLASFLGCLTIFAVPKLIKKCRNVALYTHISLIFCIAGAFACFMAKGSIVFIIGYLLTIIGNGFTRMIMLLFTMSHADEKRGLFFLNQVVKAPIIGQIYGAVIGSILIMFLDKNYMYLISCIIYVFLAIYAFSFKTEELTNTLPDKTGIAEVLRNKDVLQFCALVMVPFGFQNYFFTYVVPLDASALGLTTIIVSFIYFLRNVCKLYFKNTGIGKKYWRKMPLQRSAVLCSIISAILFFIYIPFTGVWTLILISVGLAYIQAMLNSRIYAYNYELLGNDFNATFGNSAMIISGRAIGKTIAPMLVQAFGAIALPIVMLVGSVSFVFSHRPRKKQ